NCVSVNFSGLEIVLDALQEEYLPATLDVGFSVLIHNHGTLPMLSTDAVYVMPGYTTYVGLTVLGQSGLPSPYKNPCRSEWPPHLLPHVSKKPKYKKE
uniref:Uncharacterized protein n=1 Tax=Ixodes scapularis TaxID=6945 RepID=A0A905G3S2_IXOSC